MRAASYAVLLLSGFVGLGAGLYAQVQQNTLPDGEGREVVAVACSQCHGLKTIATLRMGQQAWTWQVNDMVMRGAQIRPDEFDKVVNYLTTNFGPGVPLGDQPAKAVTLPEGPEKELVESNCGICHGLERIVGTRRTRNDWEGVIAKMIWFGAPVDPSEAKAISLYLSDTVGRSSNSPVLR